jgi:hypothetical protein
MSDCTAAGEHDWHRFVRLLALASVQVCIHRNTRGKYVQEHILIDIEAQPRDTFAH